MVEDGAFSHKIDYVTFFKEILNLKHNSCIVPAPCNKARSTGPFDVLTGPPCGAALRAPIDLAVGL